MTVAIKERPILFSGPMVRAILDGRKTQTRRLVKPQPETMQGDNGLLFARTEHHRTLYADQFVTHYSPLGLPGDRLYVRETFAVEGGVSTYFADNDWISVYNRENPGLAKRRWTPSIHMPKWAARIKLEIEDVWIERVQDISEEDAIAEGSFRLKSGRITDTPGGQYGGRVWLTSRAWFQELWDSIYGPQTCKACKGHGVVPTFVNMQVSDRDCTDCPRTDWESNPWVWAYKFRKVNR